MTWQSNGKLTHIMSNGTCHLPLCNVTFMLEIESKFRTNMATIQASDVMIWNRGIWYPTHRCTIKYHVGIPSHTVGLQMQNKKCHFSQKQLSQTWQTNDAYIHARPMLDVECRHYIDWNCAEYKACIYVSFWTGHTYIHTAYIHMLACMHAYIHTHTHILMHVCLLTYIYIQSLIQTVTKLRA